MYKNGYHETFFLLPLFSLVSEFPYRIQRNYAFSKVLAHEIKNPLSGIKGSAQLLMNKVEDPENREFLNIILKETDRITKIIDQVSKKNFQLNQKPLNVHTILEKIPNFVDSLNRLKK